MRFKKYIVIILILLGISCLTLFSLKKREKLNVILIVIDALRADHLGCYGYARDTSPNIDKFAEGGVLFSHAFSQAPKTFISVPSILTSLYPSAHRILHSGQILDGKIITLPEILKKNGYRTAAFVGPQLKNIPNLYQRFESYIYGVTYDETLTAWLNEQALNWLNRDRSKPFFVYLHYLDVHSPYNPVAPYDRIFYNEKVNNKTKLFVHQAIGGGLGKLIIQKKKLSNSKSFAYFISQYDGKIKYVDEQVKVLLEKLESLSLLNNTLIILTSDHGEEFLDHGWLFHEGRLYDELIHVPLIIRLPGIAPKGKIIPNLVRHIDIMPTILDILGISYNNIMQGISLTSLIRGESSLKLESFSEFDVPGKRSWKGVRTNKRKFIENYIYRTGLYSYELYDLESDPKELKNLIESRPREAELFKAKLKAYNFSCEKIRESILGKDPPGKTIVLDEETKEELRSLGYLN